MVTILGRSDERLFSWCDLMFFVEPSVPFLPTFLRHTVAATNGSLFTIIFINCGGVFARLEAIDGWNVVALSKARPTLEC